LLLTEADKLEITMSKINMKVELYMAIIRGMIMINKIFSKP